MVSLRLELDNITNLPDGGPTFLEVQGRRSVDIGRNTYLDWSLPDPSRVVSGKHCEIHFREGGYWLTDVSTNGTYLNGSDSRLTEPTRLRTGDRLAIGDYLINVTVDDDDEAAPPPAQVQAQPSAPAPGSAASLWDVPEAVSAPAEAPAKQRRAASTPVHADALDWIVDLPQVEPAHKAPDAPSGPVPEAAEPPVAEPTPAAANIPPGAFDPPQEDEPARVETAEPSPSEPEIAPPPPLTTQPETPPGEAPSTAPMATLGESPLAPQTSPAPETDVPAPSTWQAEDAASPPGPAEPGEKSATEQEATPEPEPAPEPETEPEPEREPAEAAPVETTLDPPEWTHPAPATPTPQPTQAHEGGFAAAADAVSVATPARHVPTGEDFERFMVALAEVLDVPRDRLAAGSPEEAAQRIGQFIALTIAGMQRLLKARATSRGYMRAGPGTQVQAVGNNPLKFMPTPAAAADVLFGPPSRSYLSLEDTLDESFADLGAHQMALYAAMQGAVERMLKDLEPDAIEGDDTEETRGFSLSGKSSKKSKFWDTYKERYTARASQHDNGMVDVFMMCFSDAYDRAIKDR
ncbi:MAG: type VI secretion system-associated FHA domain protein TagH [Pseudomonadota bacterium]